MPISSRLIVNQASLKIKREMLQPVIDADRRSRQMIRRLSSADSGFRDARRAAALRQLDRRGHRAHGGRHPQARVRARATPRCSSTRAASTSSTSAAWRTGTAARRTAAALDRLPAAQRKALEAAAQRIAVITSGRKSESWEFTEADGTRLGQKVTPLDRVGLYVPGGKAAYPSSVLMNALPAKVAGVGELIMVVPTPRGEKNALVLAAACLAGVDRVFTIGGAQAVGALAYGTQTMPQVDKIVGPGNAYVAAAKRRVFGVVGIDMVAGPSEVLIIADGLANPDWVAIDLFAQAEHDELAQSILLCPDAGFIDQGGASIERLLPDHAAARSHRRLAEGPRRPDPGADLDEACEIANRIAPEHLELVGGRSRSAGGKDPPRRRHLHRPLRLRVARRLLRRAQPRAADLAQRALFLAAGRL
jgi:histidinol dehydrogenase